MFSRIFLAAFIAGLTAGLFFTAMQAFTVMPLILAAEGYEQESADSGDFGKAAAGHGHYADGEGRDAAADGDRHDTETWSPGYGLERTFYTLLANVLGGIGFALLLTAVFSLRGGIDGWGEGLLWGLGGYVAFCLAPSLGLPPDLPGMAAADLGERQFWWLATAAATAAGLGIVVFVPRIAIKGVGVALIASPHLAGAPRPDVLGGNVPAELAAAFVSATLVTNLLFWLAIAGISAYAYKRLPAARS